MRQGGKKQPQSLGRKNESHILNIVDNIKYQYSIFCICHPPPSLEVIIDRSLLFLQEIQLVPACVIVAWNWEQSLLIPEIDCN